MSTILAIDDAQDTLMLLEFDLQSEGYQVITAPDGMTALKLIEEHPIDLILLDLYMPGLSGLETLKEIKSRQRFTNTPVIVLSASDDENEIVSALELGANDYITKPYIAKVLMARIKTSLRLLEQTLKLENLAKTDFLTGLNNKGNFEELVTKASKYMSRTGENYTLAMLDIDFFKQINDQYGHDIGDEVLKKFASVMQSEFREYDILGRVGGEEFAVCMPNASLQEAFKACERFRRQIGKASICKDSGDEIQFTVSIGLSSVSHHDGGYDYVSMLKAADQFLYDAKNLTRNCTRTYLEIHQEPSSHTQQHLTKSLDTQALSVTNDNERFVGIDYEIGLNNVLGDESLFKEILVMFYDDHHQDGEKIQLAIAEGDYTHLKHLVHTLKGVACSIGAMQLFENCKQLDDAVSQQESGRYQALFDDVSFELGRIVRSLVAKELNA